MLSIWIGCLVKWNPAQEALAAPEQGLLYGDGCKCRSVTLICPSVVPDLASFVLISGNIHGAVLTDRAIAGSESVYPSLDMEVAKAAVTDGAYETWPKPKGADCQEDKVKHHQDADKSVEAKGILPLCALVHALIRINLAIAHI